MRSVIPTVRRQVGVPKTSWLARLTGIGALCIGRVPASVNGTGSCHGKCPTSTSGLNVHCTHVYHTHACALHGCVVSIQCSGIFLLLSCRNVSFLLACFSSSSYKHIWSNRFLGVTACLSRGTGPAPQHVNEGSPHLSQSLL